MASKAPFILGAGIGYVLGTRAGRERFDQLKSQAQQVWGTPTVQHAREAAGSQASKLYDDGKHVLNDQLQKRQNRHAPDDVLTTRDDSATRSTGGDTFTSQS